jgi:hypothetical protein
LKLKLIDEYLALKVGIPNDQRLAVSTEAQVLQIERVRVKVCEAGPWLTVSSANLINAYLILGLRVAFS